MSAIPTRYAGVQFRSRIEARWAAFFELMRWPWEYEPVDLDGYIPDFILAFERPLLVEVKPYVDAAHIWCGMGHESYGDVLLKIEASGWAGEALLVGGVIGADRCNGSGLVVGQLMDFTPEMRADTAGSHPYSSEFDFSACCGGPIDVVGSYHCRACGHYNGSLSRRDSAETLALWREAGNRVQWRPRGHAPPP